MSAAPSPAARPRLAVIDTRIPPGSAFLIRDLRALLARGIVIDLFLLDAGSLDPGLRAAVEHAGGSVHGVPLLWSAAGAGALFRESLTRPLRTLADAGAALAVAARSPVEAARHLAVLPGALVAARRMRELGTAQVHGLWSGVPATACWWIRRHAGPPYSFSAHAWDLTRHTTLHARKVRDATGVVVCSEWGWRTLLAIAGDGAAARLRLVHHGIDLGEWSWRSRPRPHDPPVILGVGRLTRVKGFDDLVRAAASLRDRGLRFRCEIVGGDERGWGRELGALVASLGLTGTVTLAGEVPAARVREIMAGADLLVCPFIDRESVNSGSRGIPNVVPEAMALGTPVIATDAGGLGELVKDRETGRLVPQRDPGAIARVIMDALDDWTTTAAMARRARELVETTHDLGRTTDEFLDATGLRRLLAPEAVAR